MLTPLDIHNKEFSKSVRGYKPEEVDAFLDEIIKDFESLFRENHDMKEKVKKAQEETERVKELESSLEAFASSITLSAPSLRTLESSR